MSKSGRGAGEAFLSPPLPGLTCLPTRWTLLKEPALYFQACSLIGTPSSFDDCLLVSFFGEDRVFGSYSSSSLVDSSILVNASVVNNGSFLSDVFRGRGAVVIWFLCLHWSTLTSLVDDPTLLLGCVPHGLI